MTGPTSHPPHLAVAARHRRRPLSGWPRLVAASCAVVLALGVTACSSDDDTPSTGAGSATTADVAGGGEGSVIRVPEDHETIQAALDAAAPGDLVLVGKGVYEEAVDVTTADVTIRGVDRNEVILDGGFELENGIRVLDTDGVVVENLTVRNYVSNGVFWTGSDRYRGSYLTVYRNGGYGLYAFDAYHGLIEHSYGSGNTESAFYIGECFECDAVIDDVVSEYNGLGYSGTNSGGELYIVNSTFRNNRAGIVPNSGSYELCYPGRSTVIVGNIVHDNNLLDGPGFATALIAQGNGILLAGTIDGRVERNLVFDHDRTGISVIPFVEGDASDTPPPASEHDRPCEETRDDPLPEEPVGQVLWDATGNRIIGNDVSGSGVADLASGFIRNPLPGVAVAADGNCFSDNRIVSSAPPGLQDIVPCDRPGNGVDLEIDALDFGLFITERPPEPDRDIYQRMPAPGPQENMPDPATAPHPRFEAPDRPDIEAITVPARPPT